ncbi:MAG: amino acid ABC transporter substrate-binding protein [Rhodospirillaceae bacterium]|nr:amino acid ABC transporter substrate-binding protein [Rhodospirillaceae bacterium]|tara:strand:+ start:515 stop:1723 length:1209 start_codon:yes stop_codon:yes gene_type:complete
MAFKSIKLISLLAIIATALSSNAFADSVKIGSLSAVTGPIAKLVPPIINGSKLAIKQINGQGGVLGGKQLELIVGDTGCNAQASVDAATKLVNVEQVVAIVGALCSGATIGAANNVAIPSNVVMVSPASTSPEITGLNDNDLIFRVAPTDAYQGKVLAKYVKDKGINSVAVTYVNNDYGVGLAETFTKAYKSLGGKVTGQQKHEDKKASYRAELATLAKGKPDALVVLAYAGGSGLTIIRQSLENGFFSKFVGADGMRDKVLFKLGANALKDKLLIISPTSPKNKARSAFEKAAKADGNDPNGPFVAQGYDAAMMIALAIQKAGSTDRKKISAALRDIASAPGVEVGPGDWKKAVDAIASGKSINYTGASGPHDFDKAGDVGGVYADFIIKGDDFVENSILN